MDPPAVASKKWRPTRVPTLASHFHSFDSSTKLGSAAARQRRCQLGKVIPSKAHKCEARKSEHFCARYRTAGPGRHSAPPPLRSGLRTHHVTTCWSRGTHTETLHCWPRDWSVTDVTCRLRTLHQLHFGDNFCNLRLHTSNFGKFGTLQTLHFLLQTLQTLQQRLLYHHSNTVPRCIKPWGL